MEHFEDQRGRRNIDDGGGDDLVHGFMVSRAAGVMEEAGAAAVNVCVGD